MKIMLSAILFLSATAFAKIKTETVEYKEGDAVLEGGVGLRHIFCEKK